jgi:predicted dinucleotide-binding enzyme
LKEFYVLQQQKLKHMKKIGIIGSGIVGQTLANGFIKYGYQVMIGTRDLSKLTDWKKQAGTNGSIGTFSDAASFGELLVLAVKATAAKEALKLAGKQNLHGKTVIDTSNPIADAPPENGVIKYFTTLDKSLMEQLQTEFPETHFIKAFSCVGNAFMVNPDFGGVKPSMFICGNNEAAKSEVSKIVEKFGFEVEDMGKAEAARAIEPLCILWCIPGFTQNKWSHAFKLLKK